MNLFELFVKVGVDDQASGKLGNLSSKLGNGLKTAAKIGTAAVTAAAAGITALTTAAVKNYAEYEQLVGGAELMFGKAFDTVKKNSQEAYKTVQMSQNEYLQQVNGFATGLKTALGGNEQAAAELSHEIIKAEADIIAATGNTAENVQNAFNGIMKSNFTMLDNLQIGITPTKEGFQEVIDKVNDWNKANGEATNYQMGNLADMQSALVDYIDMVGMSGYAQREASETISGSVASMKAAWSNLITGIADDNANLGELINNLVNSITGYVDESGNKVKGVADNILPVVEQALGGIATLIEKLAPIIVEKIPSLVSTILPTLINAATGMVNSVIAVLPSLLETVVTALVENAPLLIEAAIGLVNSLIQSIQDNAQILIDGAINIVMTLTDGILSMLPDIISLGLDLIVSLALGIAEALPELIPTIVDTILFLVDTLTSPDMLSKILDAALVLIVELAYGLMDAIPQLVDAVLDIIDNLVVFLLDPNNIAKILNAALHIVIALGTGLIDAIPRLLGAQATLIKKVIQNFKDTDWGEVGKNIVDGLLGGLKKAWESLKKWFTNAWDNLVGGVKDLLGIHSPSRVFAGIGKNMALGVGEGWEDTFGDVQDNIDSSLDFGEADYGITTSTTSIGDFGGGSSAYGYGNQQNVNVTVGIDDSANAMGLARALLPFLKIVEKEVYA